MQPSAQSLFMVITTTKYERLRREVLGTIWKVDCDYESIDVNKKLNLLVHHVQFIYKKRTINSQCHIRIS